MLFVFVLSTAAVFVHIVYLCLVCYYLTVKVYLFMLFIYLPVTSLVFTHVIHLYLAVFIPIIHIYFSYLNFIYSHSLHLCHVNKK